MPNLKLFGAQSIHIVLWMLKDYSWNASIKWLWLVASPPTVLIGMDFVVTTAYAGESALVHFFNSLSSFSLK